MTRFKICCIASVEEALLAIRYGASAVGLVSAMPSGPGPISDEEIAVIRRTVPPGVATFLLTCRVEAAAIVQQLKFTGCNTVQICDRLTRGNHADIRAALPNVSIVQVLHVGDESVIEEARALGVGVDALLLDSGRPAASVKELGGTGRVHDWEISRRVVETSRIPVFLAGGLRAENVAEAIARVRPFAVDVCSGVRTAGRLDEGKLAAFVRAIS